MKNLNITFSDRAFARLKKAKQLEHNAMTWETYILFKCCKGISTYRRVCSGSHPRNKQKPQSPAYIPTLWCKKPLNSKQEDFILLREEKK